MKSQRRSYALAFFGLVAGVCISTSTASAKGPWAPALDLEPSLRSAALVLAVRDVLIGMIRDTRIEQTSLLTRVRELLRERQVRL